MSHRRWLIAAISFAAAIGASLYLVRSAFSAEGTRVSLPLAGHLLALGFVAVEVVARSIKIGLGARALGIPLSTLKFKMDKLEIRELARKIRGN